MDPLPDPRLLASEMETEILRLPRQYTPDIRSICRAYSQKIKPASPGYVLEFAR
jgi:hypothetical protein